MMPFALIFLRKINLMFTAHVPDFTSSPSRKPTQRPSNKPTPFILPTTSPSNKPTALTSKPTPSPTEAPIAPGKKSSLFDRRLHFLSC